MLEPSALHPLIQSFTPLISNAKALVLYTSLSSALFLHLCFKKACTVIVDTQISPVPRSCLIREKSTNVGCISAIWR